MWSEDPDIYKTTVNRGEGVYGCCHNFRAKIPAEHSGVCSIAAHTGGPVRWLLSRVVVVGLQVSSREELTQSSLV